MATSLPQPRLPAPKKEKPEEDKSDEDTDKADSKFGSDGEEYMDEKDSKLSRK